MSTLEENKGNIFGNRLKRLRTTVMDMTQKEFSKLMGIPQTTLSAYETGRNKPSVDVLIALSLKNATYPLTGFVVRMLYAT